MNEDFEVYSINCLIDMIKSNQKMGYLRFGDGCIMMMFKENIGRTIGNSNCSFISNEVNEIMKQAYLMNSNNIIKGNVMVANDSVHNTSNNIDIHLYKKNGLNIDTSSHISPICIQECFLYHKEKFIEFINTINKNRTIFCCQYYDKTLDKYFGKIVHYIKCPSINATKNVNEIMKTILNIPFEEYDQIIFSCGQASRMLIYKLFDKLDKKLIDVGSVCDMLVSNKQTIFNNIKLRSHIKNNKKKIQELVKYYEKNID